jgi:hypothetical protein
MEAVCAPMQVPNKYRSLGQTIDFINYENIAIKSLSELNEEEEEEE